MYLHSTVPDTVPRSYARTARRDARLEHRLAFTDLEFALSYLQIADDPKLFIKHGPEIDELRTTLVVPLGHVGIHRQTIFVGVNTD